MSAGIDPAAVRVLLLDADGNLFPSEEPAFEASAGVTNELLRDLGDPRQFTPDALRRVAMGRNFRATAIALAAESGVELEPEDLERRVAAEREAVIAHLGSVLEPDPAVLEPLEALAAAGFELAAVSSSALARLAACFTAAGLDELVPPDRRYSAEDSMEAPRSKPDPAIYRWALDRLARDAGEALAVEDSVPGVRSAVGAGIPCVGNLLFVGDDERAERAEVLREAGAGLLVSSWWELAERLGVARPSPTP